MKNFKPFISPKIIFGDNKIKDLEKVFMFEKLGHKVIYFIDDFFKDKPIDNIIYITKKSLIYYVDTSFEPKTSQVDNYVEKIKKSNISDPDVIIGLGGGCVMDVCKAVSILLNNKGLSQDFQGWDKVYNDGVYKIGIPTISGTGSEVSRTTVLSGPTKKQGINSLKSMFDFVILDPLLIKTVDKEQEFYTAMDCYIHSVEALSGTFINSFSAGFATKGLEICENIFLENHKNYYGDLMVASMMGGFSIVYSEVGICHALSYGLSICYGIHHGEANCIVFNQLEEYYPDYVVKFKKMVKIHKIKIRTNITKNIEKKTMDTMVESTLRMEKPLINALGENWMSILTIEKIKQLYLRM